jgi:hypothetical protein
MARRVEAVVSEKLTLPTPEWSSLSPCASEATARLRRLHSNTFQNRGKCENRVSEAELSLVRIQRFAEAACQFGVPGDVPAAKRRTEKSKGRCCTQGILRFRPC